MSKTLRKRITFCSFVLLTPSWMFYNYLASNNKISLYMHKWLSIYIFILVTQVRFNDIRWSTSITKEVFPISTWNLLHDCIMYLTTFKYSLILNGSMECYARKLMWQKIKTRISIQIVHPCEGSKFDILKISIMIQTKHLISCKINTYIHISSNSKSFQRYD